MMEKIQDISFSVDAGIVDRLGRELVGRAETAVSELIKNSYDADATLVEVIFNDANTPGGTLLVIDDGVGMDRNQLIKGFMTISSTDKLHNPNSKKFNRRKAGRKGIGRFATQRLANHLTIITQTSKAKKALKLTIDWRDYKVDNELSSIRNSIEEVDKIIDEGTILLIEDLREHWTETEVARLYRYISDLLQPDYLSDRSKTLNSLSNHKDESFNVSFRYFVDYLERLVSEPAKMLLEKAIATISGKIDKKKYGTSTIYSKSLGIIDETIEIKNDKNDDIDDSRFKNLNEVHFKAYYFIYNRPEYYVNISKVELSHIQRLASEQGGIRLYRNGFRVLPYGEPMNDWLSIDRRYYDESGVTNIPFHNRSLFGFVEVIDPEGSQFQETASREGLIENISYRELVNFVSKALEAGRQRIRHGVDRIRKEKKKPIPKGMEPANDPTPLEKLDKIEKEFDEYFSQEHSEAASQKLKANAYQLVREIKEDFRQLLEELGMIRVLAGLGLTIGEFTHEVVQFSPSINGDLSVLEDQALNFEGLNSLENLKRTIALFIAYTSYFNATVSANVSRELRPQTLDIVVGSFVKIIKSDLDKTSIKLSTEFFGYDLITVPMHQSEWSSILFNLYTNAKKAIKRAKSDGHIRIVGGLENGKVYLEFEDNGDGVPKENEEKVFEAFFTTSSPAGFDAPQEERLTGTGLGLKIVHDIVHAYGGNIGLIKPEPGFSTCFKIELPVATKKQREIYAL